MKMLLVVPGSFFLGMLSISLFTAVFGPFYYQYIPKSKYDFVGFDRKETVNSEGDQGAQVEISYRIVSSANGSKYLGMYYTFFVNFYDRYGDLAVLPVVYMESIENFKIDKLQVKIRIEPNKTTSAIGDRVNVSVQYTDNMFIEESSISFCLR